jgi:LacI family transcriptional regulator, galactose operon repressor
MMNKLGVITNNQHEVFQQAVIAGIGQVAAQHGYTVVVDSCAEDPEHPKGITLDPRDVAGILVIANVAPDPFLRTIYQMGKPLSLVSHQAPDMPIPSVMSNNDQGIVELVKHLVTRCQRQDLVFIRGLMDQNDGRQREIVFRQELMRYNLRVPETHFLRGDFSPAVAAESVQALLKSGDHFDAIVAADYVMGIAALDVLRAAGIEVPQAVSVVGFGDAPEAEAAGLTTVAASVNDLGACAARQLISQIKGVRISGVTILSVQLIVRETCGYKLVEASA